MHHCFAVETDRMMVVTRGIQASQHYKAVRCNQKLSITKLLVVRFLFNSGYLSPESDYFNCVVNIPEDIRRVDEPSEAGEQMSVLGGVPGRLYGAASTLVGPDEKSGRINPALEPDDDDLDDPNDGPTPLFGSSSAPPPVQPYGKQTAF